MVLSNGVAFMADCALPLPDPLEGESNGSRSTTKWALDEGDGSEELERALTSGILR